MAKTRSNAKMQALAPTRPSYGDCFLGFITTTGPPLCQVIEQMIENLSCHSCMSDALPDLLQTVMQY